MFDHMCTSLIRVVHVESIHMMFACQEIMSSFFSAVIVMTMIIIYNFYI